MRIDPNARSPEAVEAGRPAKTPARSDSRGAAEVGPKDQARASFDKVELHSLEARAQQLPEVRQEKVEALRRAVRDGSYDTPPDKTAEAMLSEMLRIR